MSERLQELERIYCIVNENPKKVSRDIRKHFWKLVRQIKRNPKSDLEEIKKAAEIRNILFGVDRGRTVRIAPVVAVEFLLGTFGGLWGYIWSLGFPLDWSNPLGWTMADFGLFVWKLGCVMFVIFTYYPFGRLIAGKWAGIHFDGMCRDEFYEPTLKIDYVSFLHAPASKRKWFFFFSGLWTIITSLWVGIIGFILAGDLTGFIPAVVLGVLEGYAVLNGGTKHSFGEMGHYNREKRIERVWKKRLSILQDEDR